MRLAKIVSFLIILLTVQIGSTANPRYYWGKELNISNVRDNQSFVNIVSDHDNAYLVWQDKRSGNQDIYTQKMNASGIPQWETNGFPVCTNPERQEHPQIISDGQGGVFIVWEDKRVGRNNLYAQRISADGKAAWKKDGICLTTVYNYLVPFQIITDNQGGFYLVWRDIQNNQDSLLVQRIDAKGNLFWPGNPLKVASMAGESCPHKVITDGQGGLIIVWQNKPNNKNAIYFQHLDTHRNFLVPAGGKKIFDIINSLAAYDLVPDGNGGAILVWEEPTDQYYGIYVQKYNATGTPQWGRSPLFIASNPEVLYSPQAVADNQGGVILCYQFQDMHQIYNILYAQKISSKGSLLWDKKGVIAGNLPGCEIKFPVMTLDAQGGVYIVWYDDHQKVSNLYLQHLSANGVPAWGKTGTPVSPSPYLQIYPKIALNSQGNLFITWWDFRNHSQYDIYFRMLYAGLPLKP